mmetsp:Transcript_26264/g.98849  ORF Transcript_26264/g.98849 Transcript_26264/m.98849 type:complete len:206 (+) Transcript_26264:327-944(+)
MRGTIQSATVDGMSASTLNIQRPPRVGDLRSREVITMPGDSPWMTTPVPLHSRRREESSCGVPALVNPYDANVGVAMPVAPAPSMRNRCPPFSWARIVLIASRATSSVPRVFVRTTVLMSATGVSGRSTFSRCPAPALCTTTSISPPSAILHCTIMWVTSSASVTSAFTADSSSLLLATARSSAAASRPTMQTWSPISAKRVARA